MYSDISYLPGLKSLNLEASKGGMKVGRIKDPLYKDSYFGIRPPTFIPPFEAPDEYSGRAFGSQRTETVRPPAQR